MPENIEQEERVELLAARIDQDPEAFSMFLQGVAQSIEEGTYAEAFEQDVVKALRTVASNADFVVAYAE